MIRYISTRGAAPALNFEDVLLAGLAADGGLYMPERWPALDPAALRGASYQDIAQAVMAPFTEGCIPPGDLRRLIDETYNSPNFTDPAIVPLRQLEGLRADLYVMEQFHGPTLAFKDLALQLLGRLFDYVLERRGETITILGATSGDTGSAAIEGCRHSKRVRIVILYPEGRVSDVQRRQMTTVDAPNVHTIALDGSFDDCQNAVKALFSDAAFKARYNLAAVNSINWARIMAQIVYYFAALAALPHGKCSFVVPTGNFGNVFAAYAARRMGAAIESLIVASNRNDILTRFFETGTMQAQGVRPSLSPSMDIEISSNFERYLFEAVGRDTQALCGLMKDFRENGHFTVPAAVLAQSRADFLAARADDAQTVKAIKDCYEKCGVVLDPHTAVGLSAALETAQEKGETRVVLATAHPAKFPGAVERAIGLHPSLPPSLADLMTRPERQTALPLDLDRLKAHIAAISA